MFRLHINVDNDAFADGNASSEVARILRDVAGRLDSGTDDFGSYRTLRDLNGNDVGQARLRLDGERDD